MSENNSFSYKYSASEQDEIEKIVKKYRPADDRSSKINQIRKLDKSVNTFATMASILFGLVGMLILGFGMSCILVWENTLFGLGIICGIVGIAMMALNPTVNGIILEKRRAKIAPKILELSEEILQK